MNTILLKLDHIKSSITQENLLEAAEYIINKADIGRPISDYDLKLAGWIVEEYE